MGTGAVRDYIAAMWMKYQAASREFKSEILDSVCLTLDIHRKSANRLMAAPNVPQMRRKSGSRQQKYSVDARRWLVHLWLRMGRMCAKRLKAALPEWLPFYLEQTLSENIRAELLKMGTSTMDRILKPVRAQLRRKSNTGTKPSKHLSVVPLRPLGKKIDEFGHIEIDGVAHCGGELSGGHAWTITMVDILSGWTVAHVVERKEGHLVAKALQEMEMQFPFPIKAVYSDNGTEFLNEYVIDYLKGPFRNVMIEFYRSRPYKKNDQCYVEQKNNTFVRELFGYGRIDDQNAIALMNKIYSEIWSPMNNNFVPQFKTKTRERVGSKYKRTFHKPQTPAERLIESEQINEKVKGVLVSAKMNLNPFLLSSNLKKQTALLWRYIRIDSRWVYDGKTSCTTKCVTEAAKVFREVIGSTGMEGGHQKHQWKGFANAIISTKNRPLCFGDTFVSIPGGSIRGSKMDNHSMVLGNTFIWCSSRTSNKGLIRHTCFKC